MLIPHYVHVRNANLVWTYFPRLTYLVFQFSGTFPSWRPSWQIRFSWWLSQSRRPQRPGSTQAVWRAWPPYSPGRCKKRYRLNKPWFTGFITQDKVTCWAWHTHTDEGDVVSFVQLFTTQGLDLCLDVGGPWLTGKHQLRPMHIDQQWWLVFYVDT